MLNITYILTHISLFFGRKYTLLTITTYKNYIKINKNSKFIIYYTDLIIEKYIVNAYFSTISSKTKEKNEPSPDTTKSAKVF